VTPEAERAQAVAENLPDPVVVVSPEAAVIWANRRARVAFGFPPERPLAQDGLRLVHPDDRPLALACLASIQGRDVGSPVEVRFVGPTGVWRAEVVGADLRAHDAIGGIVLVLRDVTARHRFEIDAGDASRLRAVVQHSPTIFALADRDGRLLSVSGALTRRLAVDPEWAEGHSLLELVAEEDRPAVARALAEIRPETDADRNQRGTLDAAVAGVGSPRPYGERLTTRSPGRDHGPAPERPDPDAPAPGHGRSARPAPRPGDGTSPVATVECVLAAPSGPERLPCELTLVSLLDDPSVGAVVIAAHDITRLVAARRALERLAASDPLTGVANRHHLEERLRHLLDRERSGPEQAVAMVFVDLDGFKQVNDTAGHLAGDGLLRQVARALISAVRAGDVVARVGGDEFVVLGTLERPEDAALLAERVAAAICRPHEVAGRVLNVTASIGVALARPGDPAEDLWAEADRRMYEAKAEKSGS